MASERTEEPTPKRLEEARRRGEVAFSRDATSAAAMTAAIVVLMVQGPTATARLLAYWKGAFAAASAPDGAATAALASWFADWTGLPIVLMVLAFMPLGAALCALFLPTTRAVASPMRQPLTQAVTAD